MDEDENFTLLPVLFMMRRKSRDHFVEMFGILCCCKLDLRFKNRLM